MKKFKKSSVIVPALARIAVTAAASVSGTVAWFTATRKVTGTMSNFQAEADGGDLTITTAALMGTKPSDAQGVIVDGKLTHGSFDYANLYAPVLLDGEVTAFTNKGGVANNTENAWLAYTKTDTTKVWYGVAWKWTISYAAVNSTDKIAVIIDQFTSGYDSANKTAGGFEIARTTGTNGIKLVYGNDDHAGHVTNTDTTTGTGNFKTEVGSHYLTKSTGYKKKADKQSEKSYKADEGYIATLDSTHSSVEVTCVAWYEGTDPVVVTSYLEGNPAITATFNFYSRSIA